MHPRRRASGLLVLLALAGGCPDGCEDSEPLGFYYTTSARWSLQTHRLQFDPCEHPGHRRDANEAILAGTRWCPTFDCAEDSMCGGPIDTDLVLECYSASVEGPGVSDGACLELTGPGEVVWRFDPLPCERSSTLLPEQIVVHAASAPQIHGRLVSYVDAMSRAGLFAESGEFPAELSPPRDAGALKIAAAQPVHVAIDLRLGERRVAWDPEGAAIEVETRRGAVPQVELDERSTVFLRAAAGSESTLYLKVGDERVSLGEVIGVGLDQLVDLEVVVGYGYNPEDESRMPYGARAVVRDGEGDLVYGAPARWEVLDGAFPISPLTFFREGSNLDYTLLVEVDAEHSPWCFTNPVIGARDYTARIAARVADLRAEVDMAWTARVDELMEQLYTETPPPSPNCQGPGFADDPVGCGCTSSPGGGAPALLVLLALGTGRLRRPAKPHTRSRGP